MRSGRDATAELGNNVAAELGTTNSSGDDLPDVSRRPLLRGRLHQVAAAVSLPFLAALVWSARGALGALSASVYAVCLLATFVVSACYHRITHATTMARARWRRADHATIFLGIAGTYTPVCLMGLPHPLGIPLLAVVWAASALGIALQVSQRARRLAAALYIIVGWIAVVALPVLWWRQGPGVVAWIAAGGLLYTVGAVLFARRAPRGWPGVFGYHEVWHTHTILAAACHLAAVWMLVGSGS